ncbi:MAG: FAD-dependent oxidoreductase [Bifidobacteriaceae bacterium]|jgi:fumarate reductase flavoprotein subunit|nr:FAD-dependent oxidoreductase [Bifidobacteriaceae bacterium]
MSAQTENFDAEYDIVVIGGGGSGKSAALAAAQAGLGVALLEKQPQTGGSSVFAEGQAAFESSEQKARADTGGPFPTREQAYRRYLEYSHYRANPEVVRMFVDNSAETIDQLRSLGVEYNLVGIYALDQPDELASFHRPEGLGARCQELLAGAIATAGVDVFTSTRVEGLVTDGGAVVGVTARDSDGNSLRVGAKAVIIATGGFVDNPAMIERYAQVGRNARHISPLAPLANTGDGINMALAIGADTDNIGVVQAGPGVRGKAPTSQSAAAGMHPWLWVNHTGRRFTSEDEGLSVANLGTVFARQPGADSFAIIDSDMVDHLVQDGSDVALGDFVPYHGKMTHLVDELEADVEAGIAWKAETIEGLAVAAGFDPAVLAATVGRYNAACADGYDPEFFKPVKYLRPVRRPPFYIVNQSAHATCTCTGLRVSGRLEVLDADWKPIPGLYAVGNDASGLYGDTYTLDVPGSTNGFAHTSGRVAARHAVAAIQGAQNERRAPA